LNNAVVKSVDTLATNLAGPQPAQKNRVPASLFSGRRSGKEVAEQAHRDEKERSGEPNFVNNPEENSQNRRRRKR